MLYQIRKNRWLLLNLNIQEINEGLIRLELYYNLMDNRLIKVGSSMQETDTWDITVYDLTFLFDNWDKLELSYIQDGGDDEYGSLVSWGGTPDWIEQNCPLVGLKSIIEERE